MAFTPRIWSKDGVTVISVDVPHEVQLRYDGWAPGSATEPDRSKIHAFLDDVDQVQDNLPALIGRGVPLGVAPLDADGDVVDADGVKVVGGGGGTGGVTDHGALTGLADDDHTQYFNLARGDARYYTQTQVDTALAGKAASAHTHDDRYYTETEVDTALAGKAATSHTHASSAITDFVEAVQDRLGADLVAGTGVTLSYDDAGTGRVTITATGGGGTTDPEIVRDVIGAAMVAGVGIQITVNDADDTLTITATGATTTTRGVVRLAGDLAGTADSPTVPGLAGKAPTVHDHDDRYYTETEVDTALAGKAPTVHDHDDRYFTETEVNTALAGKASLVDGKVPVSQLPEATLATMAPSSHFAIYWNSTAAAWQHLGATITTRPTSRTDLTMVAYGGTAAPSFALTTDIWWQDV